MGYLWPVPFSYMATWQDHRNRSTPSSEPGCDLFCPIGTPVFAPADGVVADVGDSIQPATGRYVTVDFDDGRRFRALHLSRRVVGQFTRVSCGDVIAYSGASGYGEEDWSWNVAETGGAHVHMTLWRTQRYTFGSSATLDPELYFTDTAGSLAGGNAIDLEELEVSALTDTINGMAEALRRIEGGRSERGQVRGPNVVEGNPDAWLYVRPDRGVVHIENGRDLTLLQRYVLGDEKFLEVEYGILNYYSVTAPLFGGASTAA